MRQSQFRIKYHYGFAITLQVSNTAVFNKRLHILCQKSIHQCIVLDFYYKIFREFWIKVIIYIPEPGGIKILIGETHFLNNKLRNFLVSIDQAQSGLCALSNESGAVGSTYKVVVNPGDGQDDFVMTETLVSLKEFDHVEMHFDSDMMNFEQTISFAENDGAATVTTQSRVRGKSIMMRAMFAWMELLSGSFEAQEIKNIEALKTLINENTTDYFPVPVEPELEEEMEEGGME